MKKLFFISFFFLAPFLSYGQAIINVTQWSDPISQNAAGNNAWLIVKSEIGDLVITCSSGHTITVGAPALIDNLYNYKVIIDLSEEDEDERSERRRLRFSQKGEMGDCEKAARFQRGTEVSCFIPKVIAPLRVESDTKKTDFVPSSTASGIAIEHKDSDLKIKMLSPYLVLEKEKADKPAKERDKYQTYSLEIVQKENGTFSYNILIDLTDYINRIRPALEQAKQEANDEKIASLTEEEGIVLLPHFSISTNMTNERVVKVDSLMPRQKQVFIVLPINSEYAQYMDMAEKCYDNSEYRRAYELYDLARKSSSVDEMAKSLIVDNMNRCAKCNNAIRRVRKSFDRGDYLRKNQTTITSEIDSVAIYFDYCLQNCDVVLRINPNDEYCREVKNRITYLNNNVIKHTVYGDVVNNMKQYEKIAGVSIYGVPSYYRGSEKKVIGSSSHLLGKSRSDGSFQVELTNKYIGLVFVHETDKQFKEYTFEPIPADKHRKMTVKMRPKNLNK